MKKNNLKKSILYICLAGLTFATCLLGACKNDSTSEEEINVENVPVYSEPTFADTDIEFVKDGKTDYKILVPDEYDWRIQYAVSELTNYFQRATDIALLTVSDGDVVVDENSKYISLGKTQIYESLEEEVTIEEYKEDGHLIKTVNNSVAIVGADDWGVYYGVQFFSKYQLGARYYAADTIVTGDYTQGTLYLKDFNWKNVPDFAQRALNLSYYQGGEMADIRHGNNSSQGRNWIGWAHTIFQLLPPATYKSDHPEWYAASGNQICYTNMEMRDELVEVIKKRIADTGYQHINLEIGQSDGYGKCVCDECVAEENTYGGWGGVQMRFINDINDRLQAWLKETYPERTLKLCVFAYFESADAPVIKNADGTYSPIHESVVAHENVGIMIAPLGADWSHSLWDEVHNKRWAEAMKGWEVIEADVYIWSYCTVFTNLLVFHDNWSYVKENYMNWKDMGAIYIFDQGLAMNTTAFGEMSAYVRSRLMWDVDADVEYYIDDFVDTYYGAGAPQIHKYLDMVRTRMRMIERERNANGELFQILTYITDQPELVGEEFWPQEWLENAIALFDEAIEACESIEDEEQRELYIRHIKKERLSPIYLLMEIYRTQLSSKDCLYYADMFVEDCELCNIVWLSEGKKTVIDVTNQWYAEAEK